MSEQLDSLTMGFMRRMEAHMAGLREDLRDLQRQVAQLETTVAAATRRMDHAGGEVELIWRRLNLKDAPEAGPPGPDGSARAQP